MFVAAPTTMADAPSYKSLDRARDNFYQPLRDRLAVRRQCVVDLAIEVKRLETGSPYKTMFASAFEADVYVADLTGLNANVYLELGVRWTARDGVTIPVMQAGAPPGFNVRAARVFTYGHRDDRCGYRNDL